MLLTACGTSTETNLNEAEPAGDDVEIVTVTQYNDGTVLGPDDEIEGDANEPESVNAAEAEADHREDPQDEQSSDLAPGEYEYIGTVEKQTTEEVLNGRPDPNPNYSKPSDRYYVLVLDEPTEITANKAGDRNFSQVNEIIDLGKNNGYLDSSARWEPYVGKRVRLIVTDGNLNYASDTSLPLGAVGLADGLGRVEEL